MRLALKLVISFLIGVFAAAALTWLLSLDDAGPTETRCVTVGGSLSCP